MQIVASTLWRRLDAPGHDACRLESNGQAWQIDGAAVFRHDDGRLAQLHYRVRCDRHWHTQWGTVRGWLGGEAVDVSITRDAQGRWKLNDAPVPDLAHCVELDLGFTPATNLIALRRLNLQVGEAAEAPAARFGVDDCSTLSELGQRYERRGAHQYAYRAPRFDFEAVIGVSDEGLVRHYPPLWEAEH